ncbi:MAG: hypothetical protein V1703_04290 [Candidatus Altiarchaeota archaeon]
MKTNVKKAVRDYLKASGVQHLDKPKQLIAIVESVARIPWGDGRTIEEVLTTKKVGTCMGKHMLLEACLKEFKIGCKQVVCTFRWGDQSIRYPENLKAILKEGEWEHGHNFLQIQNTDGDYIDVDVTWNPKMKPYGFRTFPENWGGRTRYVGVDNMIRRWDTIDVTDMKKHLIESLNTEVKLRRERFIAGFIKWVDSINQQGFNSP